MSQILPFILLVLCLPAHADTESPTDTGALRIYPAAHFADAQPQTAFDMIERLPGFSFDAGDENVRGYAGSSGNVLIDGQRSASKYDDLQNILERIPASAVDRIELIRGAGSGVDMQGRAVVANVVRHHAAALNARAEFGLYLHGDDRTLPEARLEGSRRWNGRLLEGAVHLYELADDDSGSGTRQRFDTAGTMLRNASNDLTAADSGSRVSLGYEQALAGGRLRLNSALLVERSEEDEIEEAVWPERSLAVVTERRDIRQTELGLHFDRAFGADSEFAFLAIHQAQHVDEIEREREEESVARFDTDSTSGESILRSSVRTAWSNGVTVKWGLETAFNFLDYASTNLEGGVPVALPAANVRVEERRGEGFGSVAWRVGDDLAFELGTAVQYSSIRQSGDGNTGKSLHYTKPRALLTWTPTATDQLRVQLERSIGQLDFEDFVSSTEFSTGTVNAGNPQLEPATAWDFTASWERSLGKDATVVLTAYHSRISNVVDVVPVYADTDGDGVVELYEGTGNIGDGRVSEARIGFNLSLDTVGVPGGLLTGEAIYRHTSVTDPLTGGVRRISGRNQPHEANIEFSQDLPRSRVRWGIEVTFGESEPEFRLDELRVETEGPWFGVFAEYFPAPAWSIELAAQNLGRRENTLTRSLYNAPRNVGAVAATDIRSRRFAPYVHLNVTWHRAL